MLDDSGKGLGMSGECNFYSNTKPVKTLLHYDTSRWGIIDMVQIHMARLRQAEEKKVRPGGQAHHCLTGVDLEVHQIPLGPLDHQD